MSIKETLGFAFCREVAKILQLSTGLLGIQLPNQM